MHPNLLICLLLLGRTMVINVEYNQLDPSLRANGHADGDVNCETGYSPFPGNINQVCTLSILLYKSVHAVSAEHLFLDSFHATFIIGFHAVDV